jgi:hypothetical protein
MSFLYGTQPPVESAIPLDRSLDAEVACLPPAGRLEFHLPLRAAPRPVDGRVHDPDVLAELAESARRTWGGDPAGRPGREP